MMSLKRIISAFLVFCLTACVAPAANMSAHSDAQKPNIVLIVFEDMSPRIGAFGDDVATTPYLDSLAAQSVLYPNSFTSAGVCAPSRSALITGVHQQTLGTHQMRTRSPIPGMTGGGPIEYDAVPPLRK